MLHTFRLTICDTVVEVLLDGLKPHILQRLTDPEGKGIIRILISTPLPESAVAPYLTQLAAIVEPKGVKVGSYPRWGKKSNTVTLVGRYVDRLDRRKPTRWIRIDANFFLSFFLRRDQAFLESIIPEVAENVKGRRVLVEGEDDDLSDH